MVEMNDQRTFFLTTIPGLESVTHLELCEKWGRAAAFFSLPSFPEVEIFKGGIEFKAPLHVGFALQPYLRTSTRMLLREASFEAGHEREFVKGLKSIPWKEYFKKGSHFDFKFTSKSSKISMNSQVLKCLTDVLKPNKVSHKKDSTMIFVRVFRDKCNISIDCTGVAAFKRGNSKGSIASLRETTANGLLRVLLQGVHKPFTLIDPMCGSGTFIKEAFHMNEPMDRSFKFHDFPCFSESEKEVLEFSSEETFLKESFGADLSKKALDVCKKNLAGIQNITLAQQDLFSQSPQPEVKDGEERVVVLNPPWGKRLPGASQDVLGAVYKIYRPTRIGLLMPAHWKINTIPLEKVRDLPILNSGVENRFLVFA